MGEKKSHSHEPAYRIHIDAAPHHARSGHQAHASARASVCAPAKARPAHAAHPVVHAHPVRPVAHAPEQSRHPHSKPHRKIWAFIWDKLQFVFVSVAIFAVIYTALNWQALALNVSHYWNVWRGVKSPLERFVAEKQAEPEKLLTSSAAPGLTTIPPLNLEVYPADARLIIPRINQNVPVIGVKNENLIARRWEQLEADIQKALRNGVIHYPGTALPGDSGNVVLTGHSSYYAWDAGRFKDVFALLHDVKMGDKLVMYFNQKKFVYEVTGIKVALPKDVDVLAPTNFEQLTLITCTPIGTNLKRLIVTAKLVEKS